MLTFSRKMSESSIVEQKHLIGSSYIPLICKRCCILCDATMGTSVRIKTTDLLLLLSVGEESFATDISRKCLLMLGVQYCPVCIDSAAIFMFVLTVFNSFNKKKNPSCL